MAIAAVSIVVTHAFDGGREESLGCEPRGPHPNAAREFAIETK
ncbi:MAG TPA: hypothetical protein VGR76_08340 [Candidatus Angelobacter sp.]|nr:hypothetical protein [Candidatus Angelobacter sp.]